MKVSFWGVRGTFPALGQECIHYGRDTMCIGIEVDGLHLVLDAGSGLEHLGDRLMASPISPDVHILLSHGHLDHLLGLQRFRPFWRADARFTFWTPDPVGQQSAAQIILSPPFFPAEAGASMKASIIWKRYQAGDRLLFDPGVEVTSFSVNHPGGAQGFRITSNGRSLCYVTDHEHGDPAVDAALIEHVRGADLLLHDATFTPEEMEDHIGWGHSTWLAAAHLQTVAQVKRCAFIHHEPGRSDAGIDEMARSAEIATGGKGFFARQGQVIEL